MSEIKDLKLSIVALLLLTIIGTEVIIYGGINTVQPYYVNILCMIIGVIMLSGGMLMLPYITVENNTMSDIVVTERSNDFHACIRGHPELWGCGKNYDEAVGSVIRSHKEYFNIKIEYPI